VEARGVPAHARFAGASASLVRENPHVVRESAHAGGTRTRVLPVRASGGLERARVVGPHASVLPAATPVGRKLARPMRSRSIVRAQVGTRAGHGDGSHVHRAAPDSRTDEGREDDMNGNVRRKLGMAVRVRDFSRMHPSTDANYATVIGRLEERIARLETLARQQQGAILASRSATERRRAVRRRLQDQLLRHLVRVAEAAAKEDPALEKRFPLPDGGATHEEFRALARQLLEQGRERRDFLLTHGLADGLLDDLAAAMDQLDASMAATNEARAASATARGELEQVSGEVMEIVELLDGFNRYRFGDDPGVRGAWERARRLVAVPEKAKEEGPSEAGGDGVVKPAA
jgi:hypothetical protein